MSLKLGNTDINKGYLGSTEINKAYLGNTLIFGDDGPQYHLALGGNVQQDFLRIPQDEKKWQVPASGDFEFGVRMDVPSVFNVSEGIIGYSVFAGVSDRWGVNITGGGLLNFYASQSGGVTYDIIGNYGGQTVDLRCGYYDTPPRERVYVNGVMVASTDYGVRPTALGSGRVMFIGAFGNSAGNAPQPNNYLNGNIYSFFIDTDNFKVNEGAGFNINSTLGITSTGFTSNAGGLTYWNSNVWQLDS